MKKYVYLIAGLLTLFPMEAFARTAITTDTDYYIRSDGSDSNDCSADDSSNACLTLPHVAAVIKGLDLNGHVVHVHVGSGTYTSGFEVDGGIPGNSTHDTITIEGDLITPSNVVINAGANRAFYANEGGKFTVNGGFKIISGSTSYGMGLRAEGDGSILYSLGGLEFGLISVAISAERGGMVYELGSYTLSGDNYYHIAALQKGHVIVREGTKTFTGTPHMVQLFVMSDRHSIVEMFNNTFSGSVTGYRMLVNGNSTLFTWGLAKTSVPGNATYPSGDVQTGSVYY